VIGIDFGTGSVRALLVDAHNGEEIAHCEFEYPRWKKGLYCDASLSQFRQHPLDHIEGLEHIISKIVGEAGTAIAAKVRAISVDTTGSTPVAVDREGVPLALKQGFGQNPNAMFFMWKDHCAKAQADEINRHAREHETNYLKYVGDIYSPEWFWAKLMYVLQTDNAVAEACHSWVEHCDWIPFFLCGGNNAREIKRGICAAGHKALWAEEHGGLPSIEFLSKMDISLKKLQHPLYDRTYGSHQAAGTLSEFWAKRFGLSTDVLVGVGALDAHMGAVGGQIEPHHLSKVMGTSTCDMMILPQGDHVPLVPGLCGQVPGSIVPGMIGFEAGQSAFGDVFAWYNTVLTGP